ncbi:hypothetical protein L202_01910 [Cryptococcus amylolentus CBS 6039]|uniref:Arrestin C-terminal-like domain-containing protein n=1 Tax=Cryptococcus amylolentus CBS 6039 TaxID=1295533 RepID=A0A1E3HYZ1_9TREE|nr:hypothetical protein L202_01910 [Cryptococcus amylolentus CBS 6039]ODN81487.1 hypothetical protein L202_01910 [Cryptococcus amylolentus CBS 6039]
MAHPARLNLLPPPHIPFEQGFPGIPKSPNRKPPSVQGTLEVRLGTVPVKAKWIRVELRKSESLPPGFPGAAVEESWEHVGEIQTLWKPSAGKEWDLIQATDYTFVLDLPAGLPPSIELPRSTGVKYTLVAALCYKQKGGMFKKESFPIIKQTVPIHVIKYETLSSWPVYNIPETRTIKALEGLLDLTVSRPSTAFSAGDKISLIARLKSSRPQPFKLLGFKCNLLEVITFIPPPPDPNSKSKKHQKISTAPVTKSRIIQTVTAPLNETVGRGGEKGARLEMQVGEISYTARGTKIEVEYDLEVSALVDGIKEKVEMRRIRCTVGPYTRANAQQTCRQIGYVESLCPETPSIPNAPTFPDMLATDKPLPPRTASMAPHNGVPPVFVRAPSQPHPIQGYTPRHQHKRQSSMGSTNTDTTTTGTTATHDFSPQVAGNGRGYQSVPNQRRSMDVTFPQAHPSRPKTAEPQDVDEPPSPVSSLPYQRQDSNEWVNDEASRRFSSVTTGTFGRWDLNTDVQTRHGRSNSEATQTPTTPVRTTPLPSARTPPSAYQFQSAEQEKKRQNELYANARARAAQIQSDSGASLERIGLASSTSATPSLADLAKEEEAADDVPPPEYAPPRPVQPGGYSAPAKPVSSYTDRPSPSPRLSMISSAPRASSPSSSITPFTPPPAIPAKPNLDNVYLSAAQEKEAQRKRWEEATSRVQGGPEASGSGAGLVTPKRLSGPPSSGGHSSPGVPSGLSEKEQMRRYYEAQERVAAANNQGEGSSSQAGSDPQRAVSSNSISGLAGPGGPVDEKEQMRRYYEAQDRVAAVSNGASGSGSGSRVVSSPTHPARQTTAPVPGASSLGEKEQMKRYYEAQDRVAAAAGGSGLSGASGSGTTISPKRQSTAPVSSALSEKEQMRRYYEAQDRVSAAAGNSPSASASSSRPPESSTATQSPAPVRSTSVPPPLDEKEQMRRYFEAQDRVAAAARGEGSSSAGHSQPTSSSDAPPSLSGPSNGSSSSRFPSAEEEKDLMRQRYESAQTAVHQRFASPPNSPPASLSSRHRNQGRGGSPFGTPPSSAGLGAGSSSGSGLGRPLSIATAMTPPESPLKSSGGRSAWGRSSDEGHGSGSAFGSGSGHGGPAVGAPPPLPAKPPREYITLLSPLGE